MNHQVGDLVARRDREGKDIKLGYISRITEIDGHGYYVYFFDWDKELWYSEDYVSAFKEILEKWRKIND
jgi:hypothetical protein